LGRLPAGSPAPEDFRGTTQRRCGLCRANRVRYHRGSPHTAPRGLLRGLTPKRRRNILGSHIARGKAATSILRTGDSRCAVLVGLLVVVDWGFKRNLSLSAGPCETCGVDPGDRHDAGVQRDSPPHFARVGESGRPAPTSGDARVCSACRARSSPSVRRRWMVGVARGLCRLVLHRFPPRRHRGCTLGQSTQCAVRLALLRTS